MLSETLCVACTARNRVVDDQSGCCVRFEYVERSVDIVTRNPEGIGTLDKAVQADSRGLLRHGVIDTNLGHVGEELVSEVTEQQRSLTSPAGCTDVVVCAGTLRGAARCGLSVSAPLTDSKSSRRAAHD